MQQTFLAIGPLGTPEMIIIGLLILVLATPVVIALGLVLYFNKRGKTPPPLPKAPAPSEDQRSSDGQSQENC